MTERAEQGEIVVDPEQAYDYLMLLRGEPNNIGVKRKEFTPEEITRANQLIDQITATSQGISPVSLRRMMFDSPIDKVIPGTDGVLFGWFDFAVIAGAWEKPKKGDIDQYAPHRLIMERDYLAGDTERRFLVEGGREVSHRHLAPIHHH